MCAVSSLYHDRRQGFNGPSEGYYEAFLNDSIITMTEDSLPFKPINNKWFEFIKENFKLKLNYCAIGKGEWVLPECYTKYHKELLEFEVRKDDIWVITYPKSGTTWTQEMVWYLVNDFDYERGKELLTDRFPMLELNKLCEYPFFIKKYGDTLEKTKNLKSPRTIKSHLPKELLPRQLWTIKPKIIYCARDYRDVAVSFFNFDRKHGFNGPSEGFYEAFLNDSIIYSPFWNHILDFWEMREEPNVLFNCYEEMKENIHQVIRRTAKFLGKNLTEEQLNQLASHLDFNQMKINKSIPYDFGTPPSNPNCKFMRKGIVGDYKNEMSIEMIKKFDCKIEQVLKHTDYKIGHSGGHDDLNQ